MGRDSEGASRGAATISMALTGYSISPNKPANAMMMSMMAPATAPLLARNNFHPEFIASPSHFDARIQHAIQPIHQHVHDHDKHTGNQQQPQHERKITIQYRIERQAPKAWPVEDGFHQDCARH